MNWIVKLAVRAVLKKAATDYKRALFMRRFRRMSQALYSPVGDLEK